MILNQPAFFARSATLDGAISDTDTQITLTGLSARFTDAVAAGTAGYEATSASLGPFRISDDDGFELIAITGHVSGSTFEVEREIHGTTAQAWADGTPVRSVFDKVFHEKAVASEALMAPVADVVESFNQVGYTNLAARLDGYTSSSQFTNGIIFFANITIYSHIRLTSVRVRQTGADVTSDGLTHMGLFRVIKGDTEPSLLVADNGGEVIDAEGYYSFAADVVIPPGGYALGVLNTGYATPPSFRTWNGRATPFDLPYITGSLFSGSGTPWHPIMHSDEDDLTDLSAFTTDLSSNTTFSSQRIMFTLFGDLL